MDNQRDVHSRLERMILSVPRSVNFVVIAALLAVLLIMLERGQKNSGEASATLEPANYAQAMTHALEEKLTPEKIEEYGITVAADTTAESSSNTTANLVLRIRGLQVDSQPRAYRALLAAQKPVAPIEAELVLTTRVFLDANGIEMLRIDAQLLNSMDGFQLWHRDFESQLDDLDAIYLEICRALSEAMEHTVEGADEGQMVRNPTPIGQVALPRT